MFDSVSRKLLERFINRALFPFPGRFKDMKDEPQIGSSFDSLLLYNIGHGSHNGLSERGFVFVPRFGWRTGCAFRASTGGPIDPLGALTEFPGAV